MTKATTLFYIMSFLIASVCNGQQKQLKMENKINNPLLCDPETGVCEIPTAQKTNDNEIESDQKKPVKIIYLSFIHISEHTSVEESRMPPSA